MAFSISQFRTALHTSLGTALVIAFLVTIGTGCEKFANGIIHEVNFPEHEPSIAVSMTCDEGSDELKLLLSQSAGVMDPEGSALLEEATAELSLNGLPWLTLDADDFDGTMYRVNLPQALTIGGQTLDLAVSSAGLERVTAQATMPPTPAIVVEIEFNADSISGEWSGEMIARDHIEVQIAGRDGVSDWFLLAMEVRTIDPISADTSDWFPGYLDGPPDPRLQELHSGNTLVSDEGLGDGDLEGLTFYIEHSGSSEWDDKLRHRIKVTAVSESYARHLLSLSAYYMSDGNPFSEPVTVYSNISSGFGMLGLRNSTAFEIQ